MGDNAAKNAAIKISEGFILGYCHAKPGCGPMMHNHNTNETFSVFAEGDMSRVLLRGDRQIHCLRPLKHFEGMLVSGCHHRIDRFTILNIEAVRELRPMAGARGAVVLSDSEQVMTIGRAGTSRLRQLLANRTPSRAP